MPDHVHMVVLGQAGDSDLLSFVKLFKQLTGYHPKTEPRATVWQQSFHDRVLRSEAEVAEAVEYVLNNPLVEGLFDGRTAYRWLGGRHYVPGTPT